MTSPIPSQQPSRTSTGALSQQSTLLGGGTTPPLLVSGEVVNRAIRRFRARLTGKELAEISNTTYEELCKDLFQVQQEQERRLESMNLARIHRCLEAMGQFGEVIQIFLNVHNGVAFVWGPMKFLLLVCSRALLRESTR